MRVSTAGHNAELQAAEPGAAGGHEVFVDHACGVLDRRPELDTVR